VKGGKRRQNIVNMITHQDSQSSIIGEYDGSKASEKVVVTRYLNAQIAGDCDNFIFDALHTSEVNLPKKGNFLAQVKKNRCGEPSVDAFRRLLRYCFLSGSRWAKEGNPKRARQDR